MAVAMVSACNGVGDGAKPIGLTIVKTNAALGRGAKSNLAFVCIAEPLGLTMDFDHHPSDSGFASRAKWTSSNPAVAEVSNGDIFLPGSTTDVYSAGVLIPKAAGTTTITASFSELSTSYEVTVAEPDAFTIEPTSQSMAKHSFGKVTVKVTLAGFERDATSLAEWSFTDTDEDTSDDESPNDIVAVGAATGVLSAGDTLGSRVVQAKFAACPEGSASAAKAASLKSTVNVRDLKTLTLSGESDAAQPINLMTVPASDDKTAVVATTKAMKVIGGFGDGVSETQDLSSYVTLKSSDATIAIPSATNVLAVKAGTVTVTATYPSLGTDDKPIYDDVGPVTSNAVSVTVAERTLSSLAIAPAAAQTIDALGTQQYQAVATFTDSTTQDVTRHVSWSWSDTSDETPTYAKLAIGSGASQAGLVVSNGIPDPGPDVFDITATSGSGDNAKKATVKLTVQAP